MKKTITILFSIMLSVTAFSQKDTTKKKPELLTDSAALFSIKDLNPIYDQLRKLPYETAAPFIDYLNQLAAMKTEEWRARQRKK